MSQKHPTSNSDRVSPRRRFHRPAAEFLGARRQVPVLTGLPSIGEVQHPKDADRPSKPAENTLNADSKMPSSKQIDSAIRPSVSGPAVTISSISGSSISGSPISGSLIADPGVTMTPSIAPTTARHQESEIAPDRTEFDAHELAGFGSQAVRVDSVPSRASITRLESATSTWRDWAYPVTGTLIACLLLYAAWEGFKTSAEQAQQVTPSNITFESRQFAAPAPVVANVRSVELSEPQAVPRLSFGNQRPFVDQPLVEAPFAFSEPRLEPQPKVRRENHGSIKTLSPVYVEKHDVAGWDDESTEVATKLDAPLGATHAPRPMPSIEPVESQPEPESEREIPFMAAGPGGELQGELTSGEPTEAEYPSTDFANELPLAPQAAIDHSPDFAAARATEATSLEIAPWTPASASNSVGPNISPNESTDHFVGFAPQDLLPSPDPIPTLNQPLAVPSAGVGSLPIVISAPPLESQPSGHVIVNPHFRPTIEQSADVQPTYETASLPSAPAFGPRPGFEGLHGFVNAPPTSDPQSNLNSNANPNQKSIYGSFPTLNPPTQPSIDQVRLNGNIEPFPQTKR